VRVGLTLVVILWLVVTVPDWLASCEAGTVTTGDTLIVRLCDPQAELELVRAVLPVAAREAEEEPQNVAAELPDLVSVVVTVPDWLANCEAGTVTAGDTLIVRLCDPQAELELVRAALAVAARVTEPEPDRVTVTEAVGHQDLNIEVVGVIDSVPLAVPATVITVRVTDIVTVPEGAVERVCVTETV